MGVSETRAKLRGAAGRDALARLYGPGDAVEPQRARYEKLLERFGEAFSANASDAIGLFSAPGRTEVGGNHTDHNNGRVLAAAVNLDTIAAAAPVADERITIWSDGYAEPFSVDTVAFAPRADERHTTHALIRGVAARLRERGFRVGGFNACVTSDVAVGSGLSSSAAFEVLVGAVLNELYNGGAIAPGELALAGRHAENHFFGKPSGLMDQMTSAAGGFVTIDFADPAEPVVRQVKFDLTASGLSLAVTNTGGSHADLTPHYAAIQREMQVVARALGREFLRDVTAAQLLAQAGRLRGHLGDRAVLRALHFFGDNARVAEQVAALEAGKLERFLALVNESGRSSWMWLQNCYVPGETEQGPALGLALSELVLQGRGAWRVHGGGFAGTILAFVPNELLSVYRELMESAFGPGAAQVLSVRQAGATHVALE